MAVLLVGEPIVIWTARLAMAIYMIALALRLIARGRSVWLDAARASWTAGYLTFLVHVAAAFHFYHHWSHTGAWSSTARQTEAAVGLAWGGGIYANYLFAIVWGSDLLWWWVSPTAYLARSWTIEWLVQGYLAFISFNATVVFGHGVSRWIALAGFMALACLTWRRYFRLK